jgi:cell wall assembly regulator SMI1
MAITEMWTRLESLLDVIPELHNDLRSGLPQEQWQTLEQNLGVTLPKSLKDFYKVHDGQEGKKAGGFFFGLEFIPFAEVMVQWEGWHTIIGKNSPEKLREDYCYDCQSLTPGAIKTTYANNLWIPFAHYWGGNHLSIDLDPDVKGTVGQVINFGRDEEHKVVVAESFEAFIVWFVEMLEAGNYVIDRKEKPWLWYGGAPETHFLDMVKTLFAPE